MKTGRRNYKIKDKDKTSDIILRLTGADYQIKHVTYILLTLTGAENPFDPYLLIAIILNLYKHKSGTVIFK